MNYLMRGAITLLCSMAMFAWADDMSTTTVPLNVVPIQGNDYKVGITVSVAGGPPSQVTFDTGGVGLHIFASQVGKQNIRYTDQHIKSSFGSKAHGFSLEGVIAYAPVTIGNVTTKPIPILVIQNVECNDGSNHCGFDMSSGAPPMFGKFYGELGAGMMPETHKETKIRLFSPLRDLPGNYASGFIIKNLQLGGQGDLILGLTPQNESGFNKAALKKFTTRANGQPIFDDKSLMVNYTIGNWQHTWRTAFDTGGDANVNLFTGKIPGIPLKKKHVRPGLNFQASIPQVFDWQFTTGNQQGVNAVKMLPLMPGRSGYVNTGLLFFLNYNVLYDFNNGVLGFQPQ